MVYPNRVNNLVTIHYNGNAIRYYELISMDGGIIEHASIKSTVMYIPVNKKNPGIYILKLYGDKRDMLDVKKITILH